MVSTWAVNVDDRVKGLHNLITNNFDCTYMYTGDRPLPHNSVSLAPFQLQLSVCPCMALRCIDISNSLAVSAMHVSKAAREASSRDAYDHI